MKQDKVLGIDIGSRTVKIALYQGRAPLMLKTMNTAEFYRSYCGSRSSNADGFAVDFEALGVPPFGRVCSTGYGRNNVRIKNASIINELKAHMLGAVFQTGLRDFTLLDAGGQDSKVVKVKDGAMSDMVLNDKCAASCGRYLENMATVLGITLDELFAHYDDPVMLDSTCAVFGESELIAGMSEGVPQSRLAAGVNYSLFRRIRPMLERFPGNTLVMTGGVALDTAFLHFVKAGTAFKEIIVPPQPVMNGAIGCCANIANIANIENIS